MLSTRHPARTLATLCACLALVSCGGGGGDSTMVPTATDVSITSANQQAVARSVVSGGMALMWAQPLAAPGRATALDATAKRAAPAAQLLARITSRMASLTLGQASSARPGPLAVSTETEACSDGGTVATTFDDRDNNGDASAGDIVTAVFAGCKEADLITLDGRAVVQIATVAAVGADGLDLTGSFAFDDMSAVLGETTAELSGSVAASIALRAESVSVAMTVGGDALRVSAAAPGFAESVVYETGMAIAVTANDAGTISLAMNGSFVSDSLGGRITVATAEPVRQFATDDYPSSGQFLASGVSGSQVRITVLDAIQVRLELDANGDGNFESTTPVAWGELLPVDI